MFDRYVEERRKSGWSRRSLMGISVFGHVAVGLFLFAVTLFTVDEIRPPAIAIVFLQSPPPPPPLPPAFGKKQEQPHPQPVKPHPRPTPTRVIVQPIEKPPEAKPREEEAQEEGDPEGVVGGSKEGVAGGRIDGVEGGVLGPSGSVGPPVAPAPPPKPRVVASFIFDRERLKYPDPHLPEAFLQTHSHQTVKGMYRICVGSDGGVAKMETVTSLSGADQTIIEQVGSTWQYKPQPIPVCTIRVFEFHIN